MGALAIDAVGKYRLIRKLAEGGMAEVFLGQVEGPGGFLKPVVVKRVLPELSKDQQFVSMFLSEAKLVAQLNHPNIVQVFDFGFDQGSYFLVMEYVDGCNLRALFKRAYEARQPLPLEQAAKMVAMACEGLAFAHSFTDQGKPLDLIHRDISPENLLVGRNGVVKVADFGIARVAGQKRMTRTGTVRGKLVYMAPEQMQGEAVDCRVDVFALGIVLYELICGRRPFEAKTEVDAMQAILKGAMIPAITWRADCPPELQRIIDQAMARAKDERFADCTQLQLALEKFIVSRGQIASAATVGKLVAQHVAPPPPMPAAGIPTVILPPREQKTVDARPPNAAVEKPRGGGPPWALIGGGLAVLVVGSAGFFLTRPPTEIAMVPPPPPLTVPAPMVVEQPKKFTEDDYPVPPPPPPEPPKTPTPVRVSGKGKKEKEPKQVASVAKISKEEDPPQPVVVAEAPKPVEPAPVPAPAELKTPPAATAPAKEALKGRLESSFERGIVLYNKNTFDWTNCEVRLPERKYFKVEGIAAGENDNARGVSDDFRAPDTNMSKGWALVRCKEASAYVWWGTHRQPMQ